tara:strand:+ start:288 stop:404 length:117 start_codon:yes stop_codon:yes gene_type:complete
MAYKKIEKKNKSTAAGMGRKKPKGKKAKGKPAGGKGKK